MPDTPLDGSLIAELLEDVADALPAAGPELTIVIAGGSLLALHGLRQTTADVDSIRRLDEELYQLVRQQLLAHELEKARAHDADRVRVLHVLPPDNEAYQRSMVRPEHRTLGDSVSEVWQRLLARPDRFLSVDPALFLDPSVTSEEYVSRYGTDR